MKLITLALFLLSSTAQSATTFFDISGEIINCNTFACDQAEIQVGDPLGGNLEVDELVAGPNSTFTEADILSARIIVGPQDSGVINGPFEDMTNLTTDANGDIVAGNAIFASTIDTSFGPIEIAVSLDATAGTWIVSTEFLGLGEVASGVISFSRRLDTDSDGIADSVDNCILLANDDQRDTDADGIGNACDPDVAAPNDCIVNFLDLNVYKANFFQAGDLDTDNNGDGQTNFLDLSVIGDFFFTTPGPSASGCN